jgi:hypothetical protein
MSLTYAGNEFRTGVIHHASTSITITGLTGLRGLVGLTTVRDISQA